MINQDYAILSTESLIRFFREEKDEKAFDQLLKNYYHLIYGACLKHTQQEADAKDIAAEVCTTIWEKLKTMEVENFSSWLFSICTNHCMDFHRSTKHSNISYVEPESLEEIAEQNEIYEAEMQQIERPTTRKEMESLLKNLPADQKVCVRLFYLKKMSYELIQTKTGFSYSKIKSSLQNGRRNLRNSLNQ